MGGMGNTPATTTSAAASPVDPAVRFASQIVQLHEMGFSDDARNIQALTQSQGNVNAAVERLLGGIKHELLINLSRYLGRSDNVFCILYCMFRCNLYGLYSIFLLPENLTLLW